jgi:hypothetical protein
VERNTYGGMTSRQLFAGDKDWMGTLGVYDAPYGDNGNDDRTPNYQAPIPQTIVNSGNVDQRLNVIFGLTPKNIGTPLPTNDVVAQQTADFGAGIWDGIKAIPGGVWNGLATVADGYRGLAYLATGNISSFQPRSNVTLGGIAKGIVDNSPVGVLGAMFDDNYRAAGSRFTGTVAGLGTSYASPYLTKIPGMNYDVGALASKAAWSLGEHASAMMESWLDRTGMRMYAVPRDNFNYGSYLRDRVGPAPEDMIDPHAHHILFKEGNGAAQKALVQEGQEILRRYDIDPILGTENLTWAPNRVVGQHSFDALQNVVDNLKTIDQFGGTRADMVQKLQELGQLAARRK